MKLILRKNMKNQEDMIMKHIMEHYGAAIITGVVLVALGVTLVAFSKSTFVVDQFKAALTSFFTNMEGLKAGTGITGGIS